MALFIVGISALGYFTLSSQKSYSMQIVSQSQDVPQVKDTSADTAQLPELTPLPSKPWYDVLAESIKEIASAMVALAGAIMALVEVIKAIRQKSKPTEEV